MAGRRKSKALVGTIKASKNESEYSGSAYDRVNKMIQGKSSGKLPPTLVTDIIFIHSQRLILILITLLP